MNVFPSLPVAVLFIANIALAMWIVWLVFGL